MWFGVVCGLLLQTPAAAVPRTAIAATIRLSVAKVDVAADATPSPYGNFGPLIAQMLTPSGPVDLRYEIAGDRSRAEILGRLATLPRGTVVIQRAADPKIQILDPGNKTWYELSATENLGALLGTPVASMTPTGEVATIAGQRAERFRFTETLKVPVPEGTTVPPDFPSILELTGDVWTTDAYSGTGYGAIFKTLQAFAAIPGVEALTANGRFPLRIALRSSIMPGYEIRSEVLSIAEADADDSQFQVPAGYQKVQPPGGNDPAPAAPMWRTNAVER